MTGAPASSWRELTCAEALSLPWPSAEQRAAFAAHVCWAHSWYKHLPLLTGGEFVVLLVADAGEGYPTDAPRMHYSWKTTIEYRTRFGHLDYMWRLTPTDPFARDTQPPVRIPEDLLEAAGLTLFPFASNDFNAPDACDWGIHNEAFEQLRSGQLHPAGPQVLAWRESRAVLAGMWDKMSRDDRELAVRNWGAQPNVSPTLFSPAVGAYLQVASLAEAVYAGLQRAVEAKVFGAVGRLAALLLRWGAEATGWIGAEPSIPDPAA